MVKRKVIVVMLACLLIVSSIFSQVKLVSEVGIHTEAWKTVMNDFQKETGIKATIQQFPYANYFDQLMLTFTSGRVDFDVPYISMLWYPALATAGYIYPINKLSGYEELNLEDISGIDNGWQNGNLYYIPYMNELGGIVYRTDLFNDPKEKAAFQEKYGYELAPPKTLEQYRDIAEFFYRPPELYGVTLMGQRSIFLATHFLQRLWARGGNLLDSEMKPIFNSKEGIEALQEVGEMFKYANPSAKTYVFQDALTEFTQGRSAMAEIWTTAMLYTENPETSRVVGKASFVGFPRPEELKDEKLPMLYISWGFTISSASKNKDEALEWIKFVTDTKNEVKAAPYGNIPARFSSINDEELRAKFPWLEGFSEAMENSIPTPMVPLIPEGNAIINDYIAPAVSEYLSGSKTAERALNDAADGVYKLMKEHGYY